jgi:hypothetical protein
VSALLSAPKTLALADGEAECDGQRARISGGEIVLLGDPRDAEGQLSALWALANLAWANPGAGCSQALRSLDAVG